MSQHLLLTAGNPIPLEALIQDSCLAITPDPGAQCLRSCQRHWVIPSPQAVNEMVLTSQSHPDLQSSVVISQ
ncbi:hypothetical protein [Prochlorococcus sp. MIT 1306]|uniref:hypothetical protein n=1 Tax=Prochlorococcus sp. MIT 1306 TaxID=1799667 RepID=UPI0007B3D902|nr:hypothetical protein [Prochlorococcus sp. MIT 1306]